MNSRSRCFTHRRKSSFDASNCTDSCLRHRHRERDLAFARWQRRSLSEFPKARSVVGAAVQQKIPARCPRSRRTPRNKSAKSVDVSVQSSVGKICFSGIPTSVSSALRSPSSRSRLVIALFCVFTTIGNDWTAETAERRNRHTATSVSPINGRLLSHLFRTAGRARMIAHGGFIRSRRHIPARRWARGDVHG